jgi:hypothetical protein
VCQPGQSEEAFDQMVANLIAAAAFAVWAYLLTGRGGFWLAAERDDGPAPSTGPFLPAVALAYMAFTFDTAYQYARNRGGMWKGRIQANVNGV